MDAPARPDGRRSEPDAQPSREPSAGPGPDGAAAEVPETDPARPSDEAPTSDERWEPL